MRVTAAGAATLTLILSQLVAPATGADGARAKKAAYTGGRIDVPWVVGERFEYQVKWGMFSIGRATMQVLDIDTVRGEPCYHVQFTIHGHALFYTLDDSLRSWFGLNDLVSRRFEQHTNDNGHWRAHRYEILPEQGIWIRDERDTAATVAEPLDEASFFYFARTVPLEADHTYTLPRYYVADHNPVTIIVLGRQSIGVPAGRFDAVAVRPIFKSGGMFGEGGQAMIWFSDDSLRVPIRIRASMAVGTLDISLRSRN